METRNLRKTRQGVVISNKMDKTIVIAAKFKEKHPIYGKFVQKTQGGLACCGSWGCKELDMTE